jgi:Mrp family chromosome partitioning ATPase
VKLRDRKNEFQVTSIDSRRAIFAKQLEDVELQVLATSRELAYADAQIADLKRAMANMEPELVTNRVNGFANEAKDLMRQKLYELELEESKLKSRYSDDHPLLQQIQRQRSEAEQILKDVPDERTQVTAALNPNQRSLELELLQAEARKKALQAKEHAGRQQLVELNAELKALNAHDVQLVELERNVQLLDGKYRMHVEKLEQARINDALGRERISNIKIAQAATFVGKPTSPRKSLLLALGIAVAVGGAFALAFTTEILDQTLRTTEQIESELGVPVLLTLPRRTYRKSLAKKSRAETAKIDARYRLLARDLLQHGRTGIGSTNAKAIGVVGCETRNARSRVAADLAIQAANCVRMPVLLIDADEQHRLVAQRFGLNGSPGWHEVMTGSAEVKDCVHSANSGRLAVMTPGTERSASQEHTHVQADRSRLDSLKTEYGLVVIDMPPVSEFECPPASGWLDEAVLVVEAERTRIRSAQRAKALLERSGVKVAGVVLANQRDYVPGWLYDRL